MKIFSLILVTLLTFADNRSSFLLTINQNVELTNQVTTIILEFEGELEVIETIGNKISIETQLISAHKSVLRKHSLPPILSSASHTLIFAKKIKTCQKKQNKCIHW